MKLKKIFPHLKINEKLNRLGVKGISDDSRSAEPGDLFFVIKRRKFDIFSVLGDVESKAAAFVGEFNLGDKLKSLIKHKPVILVKNIQDEFHRAADTFYNFQKIDLKFIGITGTNGKTTTAFLIYHILRRMGQKPALIGTIKYIIGSKTKRADYTTPDFLTLRKISKEIKDEGSRFVVMEVSSHAIAQERIKGIDFSSCVFTNLSRDHLDYHKTMANYFNIKRKLFFHNKGAVSLLNIDDRYGRKLSRESNNSLSYGTSIGADFRAGDINLSKKGCRFNLFYLGKSYPVHSRLCGMHNILNILGAVSAVYSLGFSIQDVIKTIPYFNGAEGRLESVYDDIFVDYAHTPDALRNVLRALKRIGYKKIICVVGCGGDRDKGKRKLMGQVASRCADFTFITSDNPRHENPLKICGQIEKGFSKNNYSVVAERRKAIEGAIELFNKSNSKGNRQADRETCLLVAGKGHEDYQIVGARRIPFKDSRVIREIVGK